LLIEMSPELMGGGSDDVAKMIDVIAALGFRPKVWDGTGRVPALDVLRDAKHQITVGFGREPGQGASTSLAGLAGRDCAPLQ
jgi:hypothetical protein